MSAQAGIWNFDGKPVDEASLGKLASAIEQYGPDGGNAYIDGSLAMIYRAFHTILESRLERQPHRSALGNVFTWDGRLDNRDELIPQLCEELTKDQTDVAIVAAAFERWGTDSFRRIIGDWAVSIWKPLERELLLSCDYLSIRHIFYYPKRDHIWWSTDLAALVILSGDRFHIDDDYIAGYFAHDADSHLTPYREIRQVPAGHVVRIRNSNVSVQRFWRFNPKSRIRYKSDAEYEEHFRHVFRQSVRRRLRSDSPILAELSGGLDSSSIVFVADDILAKEGAHTPRLDTLSFFDKTEPEGDDLLYIAKVEERRGKGSARIDASNYGAVDSFDYREFSAFPGYIGAARKLGTERAAIMRHGRYRAVLSGVGGDEFMGGVPNPAAHLADLIVRFRPAQLVRQLMAWGLVKRRPWVHLLCQAFVELMPVSLAQHLTKLARVEPWIEKSFAKRSRMGLRQSSVGEHFGLWLPTRRSYISGVLLMANKMSKRNLGLLTPEEKRYPFLDQSLIEFVLSIPASQLLRPGERRSLMRRALVDLVPAEILSRRTKQLGARTPLLALENNLRGLQAALGSSLSSQLGFISRDQFSAAILDALNGKAIHIVRMLKAVSLEFWLRDLDARHLIDVEFVQPPIMARIVRANT